MVTSIANTDYLALFPTDESIHIDAFLTKPIAPAELLRQIDRLARAGNGSDRMRGGALERDRPGQRLPSRSVKMTEKIKVGGVIQNDQLASMSVLAVKDRPGIAAAVLDALGERGLNVQFVVQVIDHEEHDQMVLCVDRADLPDVPGRDRGAAARTCSPRPSCRGPKSRPLPSSALTSASAPASPGACSGRWPLAASTFWPSAPPSRRSTASLPCRT